MDKTVAELFAGVGGFRCALNGVELGDDGKAIESGEWDFVFANQWEPSTKKQDAYDCYCARFGGKEARNEDIFTVDKSTLPDFSLLVGGFPCLTGDTRVLMGDRTQQRLDTIMEGDEVVGHDGKPHKVLNFFNQGIKPVYRLELQNGSSVIATNNHRFYARVGNEEKWAHLRELDENRDALVATWEDGEIRWESIEDIANLHRQDPVYDIEVEDAHSFIANGMLSHNCQDYSVMSTLKNSRGIEGKKGVLWWAINDILNTKKPAFVFLENVDRLLLSPSKQRGRDFGIILRCFHDAGYDVQWRVINAGEYGYQQKRRRIYIIAYRQDTEYAKRLSSDTLQDIVMRDGLFCQGFPVKEDALKENEADISKSAYDMLGHLSDEFRADFYNAGIMRDGKVYTAKTEPNCSRGAYALKNLLESDGVDERFFLDRDKCEKFKYLKGSKRIPRKKPNGEEYIYSEGAMPCPDNPDAPARTLLTSESGTSRTTHVVSDPKTRKWRLLTPVECERINGFPDGWTDTGMTEKRRYFMMGNALVVDVVAVIGRAIAEIIEQEK